MDISFDSAIASSLFLSGVLVILVRSIRQLNSTSTNSLAAKETKQIHKEIDSDSDTDKKTVAHGLNGVVQCNPSGIGLAHPSSQLPQFGGCVYLDYNATTPIFPEVTRAIEPFISNYYGNPSSSHVFSLSSQEAIRSARMNIGQLINAPEPLQTIYFSSCGSEADNRAIDIALHHFQSTPLGASVSQPKVITSAVEHPAILLYLQHLRRQGRISLVVVPVTKDEGFVDLQSLAGALCLETALVTVMHSNNEVGTLQPLQEIGSMVQQFNRRTGAQVLLHSDAAQSLGKVAVDVEAAQVDLLTIVGHKFGAPKGIAALFIRGSVKACPMLIGGGQERGLRAGTENVAFIAALGTAAQIAVDEAAPMLVHLLTLKHALLTALGQCSEQCRDTSLMQFNGPVQSNSCQAIADSLKLLRAISTQNQKTTRSNKLHHQSNNNSSYNSNNRSHVSSSIVEQLPNTVSVSFKNIRAHELMHELSGKVACSAGSACHASDAGSKLSYVLEAMQIDPAYGLGTLRLSFGRHSTTAEIEAAGGFIVEAVVKLYHASSHSSHQI